MNAPQTFKTIDPAKFRDPLVTAKGEARGHVDFVGLSTLWFNTGTLCNIACTNCYIESSPTNDRLTYLTAAEVEAILVDVTALNSLPKEVGITGGEPFMNPEIAAILEAGLSRGIPTLVLTNAMRPMMRPRVGAALLSLNTRYRALLTLRVSVDHFDPNKHDEERGAGTYDETIAGMRWLSANGFRLAIAARTRWGDSEIAMRNGFRALIAAESFAIDVDDPASLVVFPEMDARADVPEITTACWGILHRNPADMMCATSRMVVKRRGAASPSFVPCTLLPYDTAFDMGSSFKDATARVQLNHPHCAKFCVLGGGSCSKT